MIFPEHFLETVRQNAQIENVAASLGITMSGSGAKVKLLCPFHDDTNPSMTIKNNRFRCWVCNENGDAISLVSKVQSCEFPEAVQTVCSISGIEMPTLTSNRELSEAEKKRGQLSAVLNYTSSLFQGALKANERAKNYVAGRGITPAAIETFALGYAPRTPQWILNQHRSDFGPLLDSLGLIRKSRRGDTYGFFRDRIIFPIRDIRGRVTGFGGRTIVEDDGAQKYINSTESKCFQKSHLLYGLYEATNRGRDKQDILFVVEGYTDVIAMTMAGFPACAAMGTAVSQHQLKLLSRWCRHLVFVFDGDNAGAKAASDSASNCLSQAHLFGSIRFVALPDGSDPATLLDDGGQQTMGKALKQCVMLPVKLAQIYESLVGSSSDSLHITRQAFIETVLTPLSQCPVQLTRDLLASELAEIIGVEWQILDRFVSSKIAQESHTHE